MLAGGVREEQRQGRQVNCRAAVSIVWSYSKNTARDDDGARGGRALYNKSAHPAAVLAGLEFRVMVYIEGYRARPATTGRFWNSSTLPRQMTDRPDDLHGCQNNVGGERERRRVHDYDRGM